MVEAELKGNAYSWTCRGGAQPASGFSHSPNNMYFISGLEFGRCNLGRGRYYERKKEERRKMKGLKLKECKILQVYREREKIVLRWRKRYDLKMK
jgi:hypothetical protein